MRPTIRQPISMGPCKKYRVGNNQEHAQAPDCLANDCSSQLGGSGEEEEESHASMEVERRIFPAEEWQATDGGDQERYPG